MSGRNIGDFTRTPKNVSFLPVALFHHKGALFQLNGIGLFEQPTRYEQAPVRLYNIYPHYIKSGTIFGIQIY
jgi:hypothetical protein